MGSVKPLIASSSTGVNQMNYGGFGALPNPSWPETKAPGEKSVSVVDYRRATNQ